MRTDSNSRFPALNRPETPVAHNPAGTKVERPISIHQVNKTGGHGNFQPSRDLNERSWSRYQEWRRTSNLKISQRSRLRERRRSPWSPLITFHGIAKKRKPGQGKENGKQKERTERERRGKRSEAENERGWKEKSFPRRINSLDLWPLPYTSARFLSGCMLSEVNESSGNATF